MDRKYLIVGLGNFGLRYSKTRHNIGFELVSYFAKKENTKFKENRRLKGKVAEALVLENKIYFLKPTTYMNRSGDSVVACMNFFKIAISNILIIVDDVNIPFGEFRLKTDSGFGGHKGLESIESSLSSKNYARLRIGVGKEKIGNLKSFVLKKFTKVEKKHLPEVIKKGVEIIYLWLTQGLDLAMNEANIRRGFYDKK